MSFMFRQRKYNCFLRIYKRMQYLLYSFNTNRKRNVKFSLQMQKAINASMSAAVYKKLRTGGRPMAEKRLPSEEPKPLAG